ncbi:MAG: zf-HC2 domain-containing protein, partial [Lachnospiraceae bacterium]|nr:zf-HC2 domain-containing protein [Lachnospiraceae bacterium]
MKCLEFQQQISDFLDRRLPVDQLRSFVEHADECPECREELELRYMIQVGILEQN